MKHIAIQAWLPSHASPEEPSGARSRLLEQLRALRQVPEADGWAITALTAASAPVDEALADCLARLPHASTRALPIAPAPTWRRVLAEGPRLRAIAADFDVIELASLPLPRVATPCNALVHDLRDLDPNFARGIAGSRRLVARRALRTALRRARLMLVPSEAVAAALAQSFPAHATRIRALPPPIVVPARREWAEIDSELRGAIVSLARPEPRKDLGFALESYARACARDHDLPRLCFAGPPDDRWKPLRRRARELGVRERMCFVHDLSDAQRWSLLAAARALLFPSRLEGFGMPALEAALVGCPVLVRAGGVPHDVLGEACVALDDTIDAWSRALLETRLRLDATLVAGLREQFGAARLGRAWLQTWEDALAPARQLSL